MDGFRDILVVGLGFPRVIFPFPVDDM